MTYETVEKALVRPSNRREALLEKVNSLRIDNMTAKELESFNVFVDRNSRLFVQLCWSKLGISHQQLTKMEQDYLNELAAIIYDKTKWPAYIQTGILIFLPIFGWVTLLVSLNNQDTMPITKYGYEAMVQNMRYYWWYKSIKKLSRNNFRPNMNIREDS